jgi:hypothetical protein
MNLDSASSASSGPPPNPRSSRGAIAAQQVDHLLHFCSRASEIYLDIPIPYVFLYIFKLFSVLHQSLPLYQVELLTIFIYSTERVKLAEVASKNVTSNDRNVAYANG